jgi:signal transduction histidine kinase
VTSRDEIGELAASLNTMAAAIQTRDADLTDLNQSLIDRTVELERATREALEASRLKDEFLAVMSHELRTPLNAIIGFLGIMQMTGGLDARNAHMVQRIRANSERLLALINDVLDISRMRPDALQLYPIDVSLHAGAAPWRQHECLAEQKGIEFSVTWTPPPATVHMDEDAVKDLQSAVQRLQVHQPGRGRTGDSRPGDKFGH